MKKLYGVVIGVFFTFTTSHASAVDTVFGRDVSFTAPTYWGERQTVPNSSYQLFSDLVDLKTRLRVGVGLDMMGVAGFSAVSVDFNLNPYYSVALGYGGSPDFRSNFVRWRNFFYNYKKLSIYWGLGLAFWEASHYNGGFLNPSFLEGRVLSDEELKAGEFHVALASVPVGLQYYHLEGLFKGTSFYLELSPLLALSSKTLLLTAGLGLSYYF